MASYTARVMPAVLICAPDPLFDDLHETLFWRDGIERHLANRFEDALAIAIAARPDLIAIDRDLPWAQRLIEKLRREPSTRPASIVVLARGDFETAEVGFLEAGANAILRLPPGPDWDGRLGELMQVPARKQARIPVRLQFEAQETGAIRTVSGHTVNISVTGMLIETSSPLGLATDVDFSFRFAAGEPPVAGCGQVVRQTEGGEYGVRFYGLEGDGGEIVRRFVGR